MPRILPSLPQAKQFGKKAIGCTRQVAKLEPQSIGCLFPMSTGPQLQWRYNVMQAKSECIFSM
jgi:hypothetical protein